MPTAAATTTPRRTSTAARPRPALFQLHGHAVSLLVEPPAARSAALAVLDPLLVPALPAGTNVEVEGLVLPYDEREVLRRVSADARPVIEGEPQYDPAVELYRSPDAARWWLVDGRWGLCEIDLLARSFRSFVLPEPAVDAVRLFEQCVYWPLAQLLRGGGLHLIPGLGLARNGRGALILCRGDLDREARAAKRRGVDVLGQRWVALRETPDGTGAVLLPVPGRCLNDAGRYGDASSRTTSPGAGLDLVLVADPMRRGTAGESPLTTAEALRRVKDAWPLPPLHNAGPAATFPARLARNRPVHRCHLDRAGTGLLDLVLGPAATRRAA